MFMPGASQNVTPYSDISFETAAPKASARSTFQVCATAVPTGNAVAYW